MFTLCRIVAITVYEDSIINCNQKNSFIFGVNDLMKFQKSKIFVFLNFFFFLKIRFYHFYHCAIYVLQTLHRNRMFNTYDTHILPGSYSEMNKLFRVSPL